MKRNFNLAGKALTVLSCLALIGAGSSALAQFGGGFVADPGSFDTLNGGGGGINSQFALDRANGAAGAAGGFGGGGFGGGGEFGGGGFGAPPGGGFGGGGFGGGEFGGGAGGAGGFGDGGFGGGGFGGGGFGQAGVNTFNSGVNSANNFLGFVPTYSAIYGKRIICPVTGQLLEDATEIEIAQTAAGSYSDDGDTLLDATKGDNIYTNVEIVENRYMAPEAMLVKSRALKNLKSLEEFKPYEFANVIVASTDRLMDVPNVLELEKQRDEKLQEWSEDFLAGFKIDPADATDENSIFFQTYIPAPPRTPIQNLPPSFIPPRDAARRQNSTAQQQNGNQAGGGPGAGAGGGKGGGAIGNAFGTNNIQNQQGASSYFGGAPGGAPADDF